MGGTLINKSRNKLIDGGNILKHYELVVWMVEHGAIIDDGDPEDDRSCHPPLLETCVAYGSLGLLKYLREEGARLGKIRLHLVESIAVETGVDPST